MRGIVGLGDQAIIVRGLMKDRVGPAFRAVLSGAMPGHPRLIVQDYTQEAAVDC